MPFSTFFEFDSRTIRPGGGQTKCLPVEQLVVEIQLTRFPFNCFSDSLIHVVIEASLIQVAINAIVAHVVDASLGG